jgi:hypothetical protein
MQKETITRIKLTATEGMILTNGEIYGKIIYLGEGVKKEDFYEITNAEYEEILNDQEEDTMSI